MTKGMGDWEDGARRPRTEFLKKMFVAKPILRDGAFIRGKFPTLSEEQSAELEKEYSIEESWKTLKEMGPLKAPRLDVF